MRLETKLAKAKAESADFGRYARVMLEEVPDMSLPVLRDCYRCGATAGEYRASLERTRSGAQQRAHALADMVDAREAAIAAQAAKEGGAA